MRFSWGHRLQLLIFIQLLGSYWFTHKLHALDGVRSTVTSSRQFVSRVEKERSPCLRIWDCINCRKLKDQGIFFISEKISVATRVDGDTSVSTLTPVQVVDSKKPSNQKVAAVGGGIGAVLIIVVIGAFVYVCLMRLKRSISRASDATSSVPSSNVERERGCTLPRTTVSSVLHPQTLRQLTVLELEHATGKFSQGNIIWEGRFGFVYKGLLQDGSIVAIKRHRHYLIPNFVQEVRRVACIRHRYLVKLIGYSEESNEQFLVYDYLPNGNVGNHLYDAEGLPVGKLNMRQWLLIALGAAQGLDHLHSFVPPVLHMHFRTASVLVDEKFTAKVSGYGFSKLLVEANHTGSSLLYDCFHDPELRSFTDFSEKSDVYSFGVFFLGLISGRQANLVFQAKSCGLDYLVDQTVGDHGLPAVKQMIELALLCVDSGERRPSMKNVVEELEHIQEREIVRLQSDLSDEIGNVTLGSELFK